MMMVQSAEIGTIVEDSLPGGSSDRFHGGLLECRSKDEPWHDQISLTRTRKGSLKQRKGQNWTMIGQI